MKRTVLLCAIGAVFSMMAAYTQDVKTIYYSSDDQVVKVKEFADYYRIIESGNTFPKMFRDYYSSGQLWQSHSDGSLALNLSASRVTSCCQSADRNSRCVPFFAP